MLFVNIFALTIIFIYKQAKYMAKLKRTTESFINEFTEKFGNKYDLSKFEYKGITNKSIAICPKHGEFIISPKSLLDGHGCKECAKKSVSKSNAYTQEEIIEEIKKIHGNKYDLSHVHYTGINNKITLICPKHGEFTIRPHNILSSGQGCKKCGYEKNAKSQTSNIENFIKKANRKHNFKYDYSKSKYIDSSTNLCIICHEKDPITNKEHGEFWKSPSYHLDGIGCPKCSGRYNYSVNEFIEMANIVHNSKYIYTKLPDNFKNYTDKINIVCPKHGDFFLKPYTHLYQKVGCPICNQSKLENEISILLKNNKINYLSQHKFDWLKRDSKNHLQRLDFYLPDYNIAIECQGVEHFKENDFFGDFSDILDRDLNKYLKCKEHNIKILYYSDTFYEPPFYELITDKNVLLSKIKKDCEP